MQMRSILAGVASAFVLIFSVTIVFSHLAAAGRDDLQALHFGGVGLGIAVSALIVGGLHLVGAGWAMGWIGSGIASLAGFLVAAALILLDRPSWKIAALLAVTVWCFARAYYFAFYVIEHYVDPGYRFAGLWSFAQYLARRNRPSTAIDKGPPIPR